MGADLPVLNIYIMKDEILLAEFCRRVVDGEDAEVCTHDRTKIDNMLYAAFGMSSEEILAEFRSVPEGRE